MTCSEFLTKLRELNFQELISLGTQNVGSYSHDQYRQNGNEHTPIIGYCTSCEDKGINTAQDDETFKLTNISHGAHSSDFFLALKDRIDTSGWHQEPVMFVYESPSLDYGIYREVLFQGHAKRPSKDWYWIHNDQQQANYPARFKGREYGGFVMSAIQTFKLANVYITNLVKCGLNNSDGSFKGIFSYRQLCIDNCYGNFLAREIDILKPRVIFAVGSAVENQVRGYVRDSIPVQQLPHPAGARRGFKDEHYKVLYFWLVVRALHKAGIIPTEEAGELTKTFLEKYDESPS